MSAANLLNLLPGTMVVHFGHLGRVRERYLDPNRKPGLGRVSYDFERALVTKAGTIVWGVYAMNRVRASALVVEVTK